MTSGKFDSTLAAAYEDFNVPVDQFFADDGLIREFITIVTDRLDEKPIDAHQIMRRLINLRKKGRLPRLRRAYFGRNSR
jgi:hypothetical protein